MRFRENSALFDALWGFMWKNYGISQIILDKPQKRVYNALNETL